MKSKNSKSLDLIQRLKGFFGRFYWVHRWIRKEPEPITLLFMTKGHLEVKKLHLTPDHIKNLKFVSIALGVFLIASAVIFTHFIVTLPDQTRLERENLALRSELNKIQFHLDTLQTTVDRVQRFNQKLRELTDVDKEFAQQRGPVGQGGGDEETADGEEVFDFGDFKIEDSALGLDTKMADYLERRDRFLVEKVYNWISRLYKGSELETQSVEELYEVLKGRELQLASTPSIMPLRGWITSRFGYRIDPFTGRRHFHKGLDIVARAGSPIVAPADGIVSFAGKYGSYGNAVMIFHGYGLSTLYAHTTDVLVRVGQRVKRGDVVATVGSTGRSTAPHLHYEVIVHGVKTDPAKYILDHQT